MRRAFCVFLSVFCLPLAARSAPVDWQIKADVVDSTTYHLLVYTKGNPPPPTSPFVVRTESYYGTKVQTTPDGVTTVHANSGGDLTIDAEGNWQLYTLNRVYARGKLSAGTAGSTFTVQHGTDERFYGAGNLKRDFSGDLTHPSGTEVIENGATRVPFVWSTGGYSVFVANNQKGAAWKDEDNTLTWTMPAAYIDVYLTTGYGESLLGAYARLTGPAPIPPRWTFGFMMSRWGYPDRAAIREKWYRFRDLKIPVDTFVYDYDWFDRDWEFNPKNFPASFLDEIHKMGLHMVGIRKPRVNGDNETFARQNGWILNSPQGADLRFDVSEAAYWWWSHQLPLLQAGVDGWWNDEAEQTMDEFFQMSRVQWEGGRAASPRRVWMINRGFAPGIQRFGAAAWTGDTHGETWENLVNQKGSMLNWSLAGLAYSSDDIGGFENHPTPELYVRWMQSDVFGPVMRAHCTFLDTRWPWDFGPEALDATRKAIELRYRLIPYLYSLAWRNHWEGTPLMRPLVLDFPDDPLVANLRDEWLLGRGVLVAPVMAPGGKRDVYLPDVQWYDFHTGISGKSGTTVQVTAALDTIPVFVRAGTILPLGPVMQSTTLGAVDPLEVRVYPGADGDFTLYEDEGDNYAYEKNVCSRIPMHWTDQSHTLFIDKRAGEFPGMLKSRQMVVVLPDQTSKTVTYEGRALEIRF